MSITEVIEGVRVDADQVSTYLSTLFDPADFVTFRPIETWKERGKKRTKVLFKQIVSIPANAAIG